MDSAPAYFAMLGAPGQYFHCKPYKSSMSVSSCTGMYIAEKGRQNGRHPHCNGCPVGALHAGEALPTSSPMFQSKFCPRCTQPATRIVRGVCVSCINRQYEIERGVNAKGSAPSRLRPLLPVAIQVASADGWVQVTSFAKVTSRVEAMLRVLRTNPGEVEFAWAPIASPPELPQRGLFSPVRAPERV